MALNKYRCPECELEFSSFKKCPIHCEVPSQKILIAPQSKFLEPSNKEKGRSQLKDQKQILMQRAKDYAQNNERDDFIQGEPDKVASKARGWLREDGTKRKKIDDL